jgi:hypothetical protein
VELEQSLKSVAHRRRLKVIYNLVGFTAPREFSARAGGDATKFFSRVVGEIPVLSQVLAARVF